MPRLELRIVGMPAGARLGAVEDFMYDVVGASKVHNINIQGEDAVGWRVSVGPPGHLSGSDPLFLSSSHSPLG